MTHRSNRSGFTLIELLVVVSIITLLISILLPAVGAARTRARVSVCTQNMKQHGIGMAGFSASNGDTLPNGPIAPPDDTATPTHGVPGRLARMFATEQFPVNGFAFPSAGVATYRSIVKFQPLDDSLINNSTRFSHLALYNGYFMVMSQYMTDQEGIDAMQDIFYSPSDTRGKEQLTEVMRPYLQENGGRWPGLGTDAAHDEFRTPSYRYCTAGILTPKAMHVDLRGDPVGTPKFNLATDEIGSGDFDEWRKSFYTYCKRLPSSSVDFPSSKVMYFMEGAFHNSNRTSWFEPGAIIPVALADGSAQETIPDRDALEGRNNAAVIERAGSWLTLVYTYSDEGEEDITVSYYAPYLVTRYGVRGRDL